MATLDDDELREFRDAVHKIMAVQQQLGGLREVMDLHLDQAAKALVLQANEYERRLDLLNNEADRLHKMQMQFVDKATYEAEYRELTTRLETGYREVSAQVLTQFDKASAQIAILQKFVFMGVGGLVVLQFVLRYLVK